MPLGHILVPFRWEYRTDGYDIGFGVVAVRDGKETEVVPVKRSNSHQMVEDGSYICETPGLCNIRGFVFLPLLDYVSRAHEIEIRPSVVSIISELIAWISCKF